MGNYSKLLGAVLGGILPVLAAMTLVPPEMATPENVTALVGAIGVLATTGSSLFVYFFPKNETKVERAAVEVIAKQVPSNAPKELIREEMLKQAVKHAPEVIRKLDKIF